MNYTVPVAWWSNIIDGGCSIGANFIMLLFGTFLEAHFIQGAFMTLGFSSWLGLLFESRYLKGQSWYNSGGDNIGK